MTDVAQRAFDLAWEHIGDPVTVVGATGSGKTTAAHQMARIGREAGTVVLANPPAGAPDAGAQVIGSVLRQLGRVDAGPLPWKQSLEKAEELLRSSQEIGLVVLDEPSRWGSSDPHFARQAEEAYEVLAGPGANWPVTVVDQAASRGRSIRLEPARPVGLRDPARWGSLAAVATGIADIGEGAELDTALEQALAVVLRAWGFEGRLPQDVRSLADALAHVLAIRRRGRPLWALWQKLALCRTAVGPQLLAALGVGQLDPRSEDTVYIALLDGGGRLHEALRDVSTYGPVDPELDRRTAEEAHLQMFEYHLARLAERADDGASDALEHAGEALFHAGELNDTSRAQLVTVDSATQLNALASRLWNKGEIESASSIFLWATQVDPADAYAAHGRARTLDILGSQPRDVEAGYETAIDRDPRQTGWHADRVLFYVSRGRLGSARDAWSYAESAVGFGTASYSSGSLHGVVALGLMAVGELAFADYVLRGVPFEARNSDYATLAAVLAGRIAADAFQSVVPAPRSGSRWWKADPVKLAARDSDGRTLFAWAAGRVESNDADAAVVHARVAQVDPSGGAPALGEMRIRHAVWDDRCLDTTPAAGATSGTYFEVGRYRDEAGDARTAIRLIPATRLHLPEADRLLPSDRWRK